eukprot:TRINITY_DN4217_c0_g1_i1.p1 TRINITY_DN4217_c0_g1~~TRINITY_DN4217_c0_g1_i1.p1  ORF type:complete len:385 (+),score=86.79 TRINITY_DN4217_c0_g1_i1:190-1344(+)
MTTPAVFDYLESLRARYVADPEMSGHVAQLADLYKRRLWHQLTVKLESYITLPRFKTGDELIQLYYNFIKDFEGKINQLKLVQMVVVISQQYPNVPDIIRFIQEVEAKVTHKEGKMYIRSMLALVKIKNQEADEAKDILDDIKTQLEGVTGIDSTVYAAYYHASLQYYKVKGLALEFYRNGLLYLAYANLDTLPEQERVSLAFDLSLAALIGDSIYNFQELLGHSIIESLQGDNAWIVSLLKAFNSGNQAQCEQVMQQHGIKFQAQPALVNNRQILNQKLAILSLMELVFKRPSEERTISFGTIAQATNLPLHEVELLVMKALSLKLVKGVIDQVEETVTFTWVQPRVLDIQQVAGLKDRLGNWATTVNQTLIMLEGETPELFV